MPPKKDASPKKHAKKHAKGHGHDHGPHEDNSGKDMRRAYEHLGRVEGLGALAAEKLPPSVPVLMQLAHKNLTLGHARQAADALRAAEHLSFAKLASNAKAETKVDKTLMSAVQKEFDKLTERASDHWEEEEEREPSVTELYLQSRHAAQTAFSKRRYRQALELARAAEALSHLDTVIMGAKPARLPNR
jgi:hypothetical protein